MDTNKLPPKVEDFLEKYLDDKLGPAIVKHFTNVVEDKLQDAQKKTSALSRLQKRYSEGGLLGFATEAYKSYKAKKNAPTAIEQTDTGKALKTTNTAAPDPEPPTTNLTVPEQLKTGDPATASNKEEKHLIKGEGNVVIIGGITEHGVEDLAKKMPKVFKHVLEDLYKHLESKATAEGNKPHEAPSSGGGGGGGLLGTLWDFFKGRGGKKLAVKEAEELAVKEGGKLATKAVGKAVAKEGTEIAAKEGGKLITSAVGKEGAEIAAKEGTEVAAKVGGKAGGKLVAEEGAKVGGKVLAKEGVKIGGKALGKSLLKKIPLIGAVAGLGFGAQRALHGDWLGAAGEVASGAASTIPGLGTSASIGIDAALAGRDIYKASKGEGEEGAVPTPETAPPPTTPPVEASEPPQAVQPVVPSVQPVATSEPAPVPATDLNGDVLKDISSNTGKTNDLISSLTQAIYKLAQNASGGKIIQPPDNTIINNDQSSPGPTASEVMANNDDPIRQIRSKYAS
jgi:hypothetical protein